MGSGSSMAAAGEMLCLAPMLPPLAPSCWPKLAREYPAQEQQCLPCHPSPLPVPGEEEAELGQKPGAKVAIAALFLQRLGPSSSLRSPFSFPLHRTHAGEFFSFPTPGHISPPRHSPGVREITPRAFTASHPAVRYTAWPVEYYSS